MPPSAPLPPSRPRPPLLTAGIILLLLAAAAVLVWWRVIRPQREQAARHMPVVEAMPVARGAAADGNGAAQSLLAAARAAMREQHLVAPADRNAVALYLQARALDPHDRAAGDALREIFPFAAQAVEQTINAGQLDAAQRELDLLRRVDATNYTLTLLQAKLGARRQALAATQTVARHPAPMPAAAHATLSAPVATIARQAPTRPAMARPDRPSPAAMSAPARGKPVAAIAAKVAVSQPPLLLHMVDPYYPSSARQAHRHGWVDVGYTVTPQGTVRGEHVVRARPGHLFDRAALIAVQHWRFQPATRDGRPVAVQVVSRVDFGTQGR